ncbi:ORM1-like protein 2 isoform X1 [Canis lupus familiaris]|uniref:ORM1-like protein 2 isoform X1 n=1 Tax=Canis lupus familiaris TaxID=9615 RepID=UPI0015F141CE|nr:ORM1-like protein 2 isoform X1 [Canis lupus familiaris]XP_038488316.1 ORM1-like protein 2 isoform X1 [Canis lupus familiaris]XP_038534862.1 ORM1-like protein 2 isoform X1 [Canis lupus familiaris]
MIRGRRKSRNSKDAAKPYGEVGNSGRRSGQDQRHKRKELRREPGSEVEKPARRTRSKRRKPAGRTQSPERLRQPLPASRYLQLMELHRLRRHLAAPPGRHPRPRPPLPGAPAWPPRATRTNRGGSYSRLTLPTPPISPERTSRSPGRRLPPALSEGGAGEGRALRGPNGGNGGQSRGPVANCQPMGGGSADRVPPIGGGRLGGGGGFLETAGVGADAAPRVGPAGEAAGHGDERNDGKPPRK